MLPGSARSSEGEREPSLADLDDRSISEYALDLARSTASTQLDSRPLRCLRSELDSGVSSGLSQSALQLPAHRKWEQNIVQMFSRFTSVVPELSARWSVEQGDFPGVDQYTMVAVPQGEQAGAVQCLVCCLQSNDSEGASQRYTRMGIGRASVSRDPGMSHPSTQTTEPCQRDALNRGRSVYANY
jgi:hypothetical protein